MKYKVAYATGSRADYGIVRKFLKYLNDDDNIDLEILVTGALLEKQYGDGYKIIEEDGFYIATKVYQHLNSTSNSKIIKSMSIALEEFGNYFEKNKYNLLIILGDRYEMLSIAIAAAMNKIPILHIHGGEITLGNYDEFIRHSITKMAQFHFTSTETYKKRVIQLGENPKNVFNIGAMGSENCKTINMDNIEKDVLMLPEKEYFVVLFHPETLTCNDNKSQIKELLMSLDYFIKKYKIIFIGTNADTYSDQIRFLIKQYVENNKNALYFENLHPDSYHYLLKRSLMLIGNSSSGIIEAPMLGIYTVNIGDRQKGRVKGNSIFDVECNCIKIKETIDKVLSNKNGDFDNPYYKENSSILAYQETIKILKRKEEIKEFYDL